MGSTIAVLERMGERTGDGGAAHLGGERGHPADRHWYAYRGQPGRLAKAYAGKAEDLTVERLRLVAGALTDHAAPADDGQP